MPVEADADDLAQYSDRQRKVQNTHHPSRMASLNKTTHDCGKPHELHSTQLNLPLKKLRHQMLF